MKVRILFFGRLAAVVLLLGQEAHGANAPTATAAPITPALKTTRDHLEAAQKEVEKAAPLIHSAATANRGGFIDSARTDLLQLATDMKSADAYITEHPDSDILETGPLPTGTPDPQPGAVPKITSGQPRTGSYPSLNAAIDFLNEALGYLVNDPAGGSYGKVMGTIGGLRVKLIADVVKIANDLRSAMDFADANPAIAGAAPRGSAGGVRSGQQLGPNAVNTTPLTADQLKAFVIIEGDYSKGSGFVVKMYDQYFIVTNEHVLAGNKKITATGMDGTQYPTNGALYGALGRDAAMVKIPNEMATHYFEFQTDTVAESKVGDSVSVPGNAEGAGVATQANGKISGVGPELVETDARMVPGNSGSPIIHRRTGKVVGMATYAIHY